MPLLRSVISAQAVKFYHDLLGNNDFIASVGQFARWKSCHGISLCNIDGEAQSCDTETGALFPQDLNKIMTDNSLNNHVYNCVETALYFWLHPSKSLDVKNSGNKSGIKMSKDRITLLFAVNKSGGHKLKLLCTGKSRS
ncbi:hypothetical protein C0J52_13446 [Blattella germanica]|nr:hypothetical protein C0J52_13446 [Blattella germanica]